VPAGTLVAARLRGSLAKDDELRLGNRGAIARECEQTITAFSKTPAADDVVVGCLFDVGRDHLRAGRIDQAISAFRTSIDRVGPAAAMPITAGNLDGTFENQHRRWVAQTGLGLAFAAAGRNREAANWGAIATSRPWRPCP
jgi:hypothetical protein